MQGRVGERSRAPGRPRGGPALWERKGCRGSRSPRGGRGRSAREGGGAPGNGRGPGRGHRAGSREGAREEGGCRRARSPKRLWPGWSGCGYTTFLSQGSSQGGWRGGSGGRTSLNWPGNSRGVGPANCRAAPHPRPSPPSGIFFFFFFFANPPRWFYRPPSHPGPTLSPNLPSFPSHLRVGSSEEYVSQREAPSSCPQLSHSRPARRIQFLCVPFLSLSLHPPSPLPPGPLRLSLGA